LKDHFNSEYFDKGTKDVSRNCFESYDPDLYHNKNSKLWVKKERSYKHIETTPTPNVPVKSTNVILSVVQRWFDNNYTMNPGERHPNLVIFSCELNRLGISKTEALEYLSANYKSEDFDYYEIKKIVDWGYEKSHEFRTKFIEDEDTINWVKDELKNGLPISEVESKLDAFNPSVNPAKH